MNKFKNYIESNFSKEIQFLIFLSQDEINNRVLSSFFDDLDWDAFLKLVIKHRLTSHVLKHSEFLNERMPEEYLNKLKQIKLEQSRKSLNYTIYLIQIHEHFTEKNISHCFFKGPLLSLSLYNDIGYRNFGDIDILVEKENIEQAKQIIEDLNFKCIYPKIKLSSWQRKVNYSISHHYHFKHFNNLFDTELHWTISNPKSYFGVKTSQIVNNAKPIKVSRFDLPYISETQNLVYLAAHGAIHQWYRLFWLKDFSVLVSKTKPETILKAWELSQELKLQKPLHQAFILSNIIYKSPIPSFIENQNIKDYYISIPIKSIGTNELKQQGFKGKIRFIIYRLKLKPSLNYYFDLIYRLRTHLSDWEKFKLPGWLFFLYFILRPVLYFIKSDEQED